MLLRTVKSPVKSAVNRGQMRSRPRFAIAAGLIALGMLSLHGCGVRGSLDAPPEAKTETGDAVPGTPGQPVPHKPSILDPLIR